MAAAGRPVWDSLPLAQSGHLSHPNQVKGVMNTCQLRRNQNSAGDLIGVVGVLKEFWVYYSWLYL